MVMDLIFWHVVPSRLSGFGTAIVIVSATYVTVSVFHALTSVYAD